MPVNLIDLIGQGAQYWNADNTYDNAEDQITGGFDQARTDVRDYQQPYVDFGLEHMQGYNDLGEFDYGAQDFETDPSYDWRLNEGLRGVNRSQSAKKMLNSGNTLAALQTRGQQEASQEYQAAFDRSKSSYDTNRAYHQFGVETGATAAGNVGEQLADLAAARGMSLASLAASRGKTIDGLIAATTAALSGAAGGATGGGAGGGGGSPSGGGAGAGGSMNPNAPPSSGGALDSLISRVTGGNFSLEDLSSIIPDIQNLSELDIGNNLLNLWQEQGVGSNFGDFLGDVFGDGLNDTTTNFLESFNSGLLNNGTDNPFGTPFLNDNAADIFNYTPGAGLLSPEEFQATINDDGFWGSLIDSVGDFASGAWDDLTGWISGLFQ